MCELYELFSQDWRDCLVYGKDAQREMFLSESRGLPINPNNGYLVGKKWLSVQVTMWKEDIAKGLLFKDELYRDERFPHWWLDRVLTKGYSR